MWARVVEFMLGVWLSVSWIIFGYKDDTIFIAHDLTCFFLISCFSLLSYLKKLRHLHLFNFLIAFWLAGWSYYLYRSQFESLAQNYMTLAWFFFLLSIVPSHASSPPYRWVKFKKKN